MPRLLWQKHTAQNKRKKMKRKQRQNKQQTKKLLFFPRWVGYRKTNARANGLYVKPRDFGRQRNMEKKC